MFSSVGVTTSYDDPNICYGFWYLYTSPRLWWLRPHRSYLWVGFVKCSWCTREATQTSGRCYACHTFFLKQKKLLLIDMLRDK